MHVIAWRFTARDRASFEQHYAPDGTWARLFRRSPEYVRTDLLTDGMSYLTLDWWASRDAYEEFREAHAGEYAAIDALCESMTVSEELIGRFDER